MSRALIEVQRRITEKKTSGEVPSIVEPITVVQEHLVSWFPPQIDNFKIKELYQSQSLTTRQIANQLSISKTQVIRRLHEMGIRKNQERRVQ